MLLLDFHPASGLGQMLVWDGCRHDPRRRPGSSLAAHLEWAGACLMLNASMAIELLCTAPAAG